VSDWAVNHGDHMTRNHLCGFQLDERGLVLLFGHHGADTAKTFHNMTTMVDNISEHSYKPIGTKIAISRAAITRPPTLSKGRVGRACEVCRKRRTKCSGHSPCQHCRSQGLKCEYGDKKSERITR
jgi:hypothetical protein